MAAIKQDAEIKELLSQLDGVKTAKTFKRWKTSFLARWEDYLEQEDIVNADNAYKDFKNTMDGFIKLIDKVKDLVDKGDLTSERTTVKGRNALNEMSKVLTRTIIELDALIPQTGALEKKRGYNKFHIGSVLIRDNFGEYGRLCECRDTLQNLRTESLGEVADKQILEEMDNFKTNLDKFCEIMADLGLFEVMLKCRQFDTEDEGPNLENFIFIDMKSLSLGEIDREELLMSKLLTTRGADKNGNSLYAEASTGEEAQKKLLKIIVEHPTLGFGSGKSNNVYQQEGDDAKAASVQAAAMWGVKLKKTPKNIKGQELLFVDQLSGLFGELSRKQCLEKGILTERIDENNVHRLDEAVTDFEEKSDLMERVRVLLDLGIERK